MGRNKSKNKGKAFEERVAKIFRECWNLSKHECHRALSSGTYQVDYSDIVFSPETIKRPHLVVECKKRAHLPANQLLSFPNELKVWINQLEESVQKYFSHFQVYPLPLIVFAINNMKPLVIVNKKELERVKNEPKLNLTLAKSITELDFYIVNKNFVATWLEDFLKNCLIPIEI